MLFSKLRPVGSRVPLPAANSGIPGFSWAAHYDLTTVNSGTAALSLAVALSMAGKGLLKHPEVILPAYGCPDLVAAVVAQGARPVLVDVTEGRPWLELAAVQRALTENTVGIVAVDFLGIPERLVALKRVAEEAGVRLIEDSAQAFPPFSSTNGLADYVVLSFGRGKPINLMGGGGLLVRRDLAAESASVLARLPKKVVSGGVAWKVRRWLFNLLLARLCYGFMERMPFLGIGSTVYHPLKEIYRQSPVEGLLEAGVDGFNNREDKGTVYSQTLAELAGKGWTLLPQACFEGEVLEGLASSAPMVLRYPLLAPSRQTRDRALAELNRHGIGASSFYGQALPQIEGVSRVVSSISEESPRACDFAGRLITLPTHEDVRFEDIRMACSVLYKLS